MKDEHRHSSEAMRRTIEESLRSSGKEDLADLWKNCPDQDALLTQILGDASPDLTGIESLLRNLG